MKTPHSEMLVLSLNVLSSRIEEAAMYGIGFELISESLPWRDVLNYKGEEMPGIMLSGVRYREGMTQEELAKKTGIPRQHISEMENGKGLLARKTLKIL